MKDNQVENNQFIIHYYLSDGSHSMNAFTRNHIEKSMLEVIKEIGDVAKVDIILESQASKPGGYIEYLEIAMPLLYGAHYFKNTINTIITNIFTGKNKEQKLKNELLKEKLKLKKNKNESDEIDLANKKKQDSLQINLNKVLEDKLLQRKISTYYQKVKKYEKIEKIGFKTDNDTQEIIVEREYFKEFIMIDNTDTEIDDEATIEIISPVLKEGKYKWKGKYKSEKIDFSMGDSKFKDDVIESKYEFSNGSSIQCCLQIKKTFDDFGDEIKNRTYSVSKVYAIKNNEIDEWKIRKIGLKKNKKKIASKQGTFNFDKELK
ncbi:hypothetical protein CFT12S00416_01535 [Campylobacter fetus subsp. testudinum]|uniref:hypothetical protein n=1 Tax=Campylobacter fetus TaxID=196 RepID=UPI000818A00F|nr:hypothetical protein [Campylobacter fetus]OCR89941.1 hypothetical protein CFT12S00416_01535 [Campylobacter fetus subsp. testudinum]OCR99315.1 hypothetical protein A9K75_07450 [Campylobacter fetus subsp. testudinum]